MKRILFLCFVVLNAAVVAHENANTLVVTAVATTAQQDKNVLVMFHTS